MSKYLHIYLGKVHFARMYSNCPEQKRYVKLKDSSFYHLLLFGKFTDFYQCTQQQKCRSKYKSYLTFARFLNGPTSSRCCSVKNLIFCTGSNIFFDPFQFFFQFLHSRGIFRRFFIGYLCWQNKKKNTIRYLHLGPN